DGPPRRSSVACMVGDVQVGGGAPVVVQSMTNTDTAEAAATARQVAELAVAGSEIVRITVNNRAAATRVAEVRDRLRDDHGVEVRETMVESALRSAAAAEELGLPHDAIVLSCKASQVGEMVATYRELAARCDYPLHLGLTEAGMGTKGVVATSAALGVLLAE